MYPFVTISWIHIELTGVWIILAFLTFTFVCWRRCKIMQLPFENLYYRLPSMVALLYGWGAYGNFVLRSGQLIPYNFMDFYAMILPEDYKFHAAGIVIWLVIFLIIFINKQVGRFMRYKRMDCIFIWFMQAIIILWIFLVLGDDMIGKSTESRMWIYAFTPLSEVSKFNKVLPVGLFLSIAALLSFGISFIFKKRNPWPGWWYAWFGVFFFLLGIVLLFQNYSRHGVIMIHNITYDINQYICRIVSVYCIFRYRYIQHTTHKKMNKRVIHDII